MDDLRILCHGKCLKELGDHTGGTDMLIKYFLKIRIVFYTADFRLVLEGEGTPWF